MKNSLLLFLLLGIVGGCSYLEPQKESRSKEVYQRPKIPQTYGVKDFDRVVDARPYFQYAASHLQGVLHDDYKNYQELNSNKLKSITPSDWDRLYRRGFSVDQKILVLGNASMGQGEDCKLAFNYVYMGFPYVFLLKENKVVGIRESGEAYLPDSIDRPQEYPKVKSEIIQIQNLETSEMVLDVRSESEYLKSGNRFPANLSLNIPWKDFFTSEGRWNSKIKKRLLDLKISADKNIRIVDEDGKTGACAYLALRDQGFSHISYYPGGAKK